MGVSIPRGLYCMEPRSWCTSRGGGSGGSQRNSGWCTWRRQSHTLQQNHPDKSVMSPTYKKVQTPVLVHESGSWSCDYRHHMAHYGQDGCMGSYNESVQTHICCKRWSCWFHTEDRVLVYNTPVPSIGNSGRLSSSWQKQRRQKTISQVTKQLSSFLVDCIPQTSTLTL